MSPSSVGAAGNPSMASALLGTGQTPTICLVNEATAALGVDMRDLADALQVQADQFQQVWGVGCQLVLTDKVQPRCWGMVLLDDADQAGALGYHDVTSEGLPLGKIFVRTSDQAGDAPSTVASHELLEAIGDPDVNTFKMYQEGNNAYMIALEVADAVEQDQYPILLPNGHSVMVSNWVYPSYFQTFSPAGTQLDFMNLCKRPFEIRPGGYLPAFNLRTRRWQQLQGSSPVSGRQRNRFLRRMNTPIVLD